MRASQFDTDHSAENDVAFRLDSPGIQANSFPFKCPTRLIAAQLFWSSARHPGGPDVAVVFDGSSVAVDGASSESSPPDWGAAADHLHNRPAAAGRACTVKGHTSTQKRRSTPKGRTLN